MCVNDRKGGSGQLGRRAMYLSLIQLREGGNVIGIYGSGASLMNRYAALRLYRSAYEHQLF